MITQLKNEHFSLFFFSPATNAQKARKCEPNASSCGKCFHNKLCSIFLLSFSRTNEFIYLFKDGRNLLLLHLSLSLSQDAIFSFNLVSAEKSLIKKHHLSNDFILISFDLFHPRDVNTITKKSVLFFFRRENPTKLH